MRNSQVKKTILPINRTETLPLPTPKLLPSLIKHPWVMPYNRLAFLMVTINICVYLLYQHSLTIPDISWLIIGNFALAIFIRQQYVINLLFYIATSIPLSWPLSIRWAAGKVYHFGGINVGCFASGTLWLAFYIWKQWLGLNSHSSNGLEQLIFSLSILNFIILSAIIIFALPKIRHKIHNTFEVIGRFGLWSSVLIFWVLSVCVTKLQFSPDTWLVEWIMNPQVWLLSLMTFSIALPWMRLRKVPVEMAVPSPHVSLSRFNYGVTPFAGSSTDLSRSPLFEWHSFANVPSPGKTGFRLTISRAGDWTGSYIDDKPSMVWVKGIPTAGVGNIENLFKKVIWVATGSGIGPCLPHLLAGNVEAKLIWSARTPRKTYGDELVNEILKCQPDAVMWDTKTQGKPDLVTLAYENFKNFDAEAVICIANKKLTFQLNYELERRGIPSFGAIWDS